MTGTLGELTVPLVDNIREIVTLVQQIGNIDLYKRIVDLQADAVNLEQENLRLREQVANLEKKWEIQEDLAFRDNMYWRSSGEGPYCVPCWDNHRKLMRMAGNGDLFHCHTCHYAATTEAERRRMDADFRNWNQR